MRIALPLSSALLLSAVAFAGDGPAVRKEAALLAAAIERGVPIFNRGDADACAAIYEVAVRAVVELSDESFPAAQRKILKEALDTLGEAKDASDRAWRLRRAMDRALRHLVPEEAPAVSEFKPIMEAPLPRGYPEPGPVGKVVPKEYPAYRAARTKGGGMAFWTLFGHIKRNGIEMTAPVEMGMDDQGEGLSTVDMAFLYESKDLGAAGRDGAVEVVDLEPMKVLSYGLRGPLTADGMREAKEAIERRMADEGLVRAGPYRLLGYNSPMIRADQRFFEIQAPIRPAAAR
ncbi:MAG: heme-binding protein [Planctomycetes bacterium]|nr:heme-binding protein [Planctomycetota bacterium]